MKIADVVVADRSRRGGDCFTVDGEQFPWFISEEGPRATPLYGDLFAVHVDIIVLDPDGDNESFAADSWHGQPVIAGRVFPWYITEDGYCFEVSRCDCAVVKLAFLAHSIVGIPVDEAGVEQDKVHELAGFVVAKPAA